MKSVGQLLRLARQEKGFSIDQLSSLTKIDVRYIEALELDEYQDLPSETFTKGFIRNLALRLDRNPDELVAVFRRDYRQPSLDRPKTPIRRHNDGFSLFHLFSSQFSLVILGVLVFGGYLLFQFRAILTPPPLNIVRPVTNSVLVSPLEIEGVTSADSVVFVNKDTQGKPDSSGHFILRLVLPAGETVLEIKSVNRFGRSNLQKIPITVISQ